MNRQQLKIVISILTLFVAFAQITANNRRNSLRSNSNYQETINFNEVS